MNGKVSSHANFEAIMKTLKNLTWCLTPNKIFCNNKLPIYLIDKLIIYCNKKAHQIKF